MGSVMRDAEARAPCQLAFTASDTVLHHQVIRQCRLSNLGMAFDAYDDEAASPCPVHSLARNEMMLCVKPACPRHLWLCRAAAALTVLLMLAGPWLHQR